MLAKHGETNTHWIPALWYLFSIINFLIANWVDASRMGLGQNILGLSHRGFMQYVGSRNS